MICSLTPVCYVEYVNKIVGSCLPLSDSLKNLILVVAEAQEVQIKDYRYPDNYLKPKHI